ncbi:MAG: strictosidine synthase family protein [Ilumatobacteraceae bacterium]|nr:strictosidine synthase family protein [Ilumatobacteraceae bacterium]
MQAINDRWSTYTDLVPAVAGGWRFDVVTPPSRLGGANGMTFGPDHRLYVTQVFGSQVTAIDVETGEHAVFSPLGACITGPDDGIFGADGTFFATEPTFGRVTARDPDGTYRVVRDDLPGANGVTMDHAGRRLFIDEFRPGGRLLELDPAGVAEPRVLMDDLAGPNAPAMGPDGLLYFPQVFADQVWSFDLDSGTGRLAVDDLARPTAVKFDSRGRLVVSEAGAGRIVAIDLATGAREVLAEVALGIDNVSVGADDRIFVSHYVDGRVAEETAGRQRVLSPPGLLGPHGLAVDETGAVLFADGLSVGVVVDGVAERRIRLLVDLPTLALGVAPFDGALAVLGASGEVLRYDEGAAEPTVLATGLVDPTCMRVDGGRLLVSERHAGRVSAVDRGGRITPLLRDLPSPAAVDRLGDGYVVSAGPVVLLIDAGGNERRVEGFGDAQGVAVVGMLVLVADAARHELVLVDVATGRREVVVAGAPVGSAVPGVVPAAFSPVAADGAGGFLIGCNGDGSIRRLTRS